MIKVVLHRVLIERDLPEDTEAVKTKRAVEKSGLALPEFYRDELDKQALRENASMDKGVVKEIGPTAFKDYGIEPPIKVGDYISYAKFGGKDITDPESGNVYVVINDEDVIAILTKTNVEPPSIETPQTALPETVIPVKGMGWLLPPGAHA